MPFVYTDSKGRRRKYIPPKPKPKKSPFAGAEASGKAKIRPAASGAKASGKAPVKRSSRRKVHPTIRRIQAEQRREVARNLPLPKRPKDDGGLKADLDSIARSVLRTAADIGGVKAPGEAPIQPSVSSPSKMAEQAADLATIVVPGGLAVRGAATGAKVVKDFAKGAKAAQKAAKGSKTEKAAKETFTQAAKDDAARAVAKVGRGARKVKDAPGKAVRGVKRAPQRAKKLKTKEGRKQARRGTGQKVARAVSKRPIGSSLAASAAAGHLGYSGIGGINKRSEALVKGHVDAVREDPGKVAGTTARALLGAVTGAAQIATVPAITGGRAASAVGHSAGIPLMRAYSGGEITAPARATAKAAWEGASKMASDLASGDRERVKESVKDDVGLALGLPSAQIIRRARGSSTYKRTRLGAREAVSSRRREARDRREAENELIADPRKRKPPKRSAVPDSVGGGEYIISPLGRAIENRRHRVRVSRDAVRMAAQGRHEGLIEARPVMDAAAKLERKYPGMSDAVATAAYYGLNPRSQRFDSRLREIEDSIKSMPRSELPDDLFGDLAAVRVMRENPEAVRSPEFRAVVDAYREQARRTETSARAKWQGVAATQGVKMPEERMREAGVEPMSPDLVRRSRAAVRNMLEERAELNRQINRMEPGSREHYAAVQRHKELSDAIRELSARVALHSRKSREVTQEFLSEVSEAARKADLETPAWVRDVDVSADRSVLPHAGASSQRAGSKAPHFREGTARARGSVDRRFETLIQRSVIEPRVARAQHRFMNETIESGHIKIRFGDKTRSIMTTNELTKAARRGIINDRDHVVIHSQHWRSAALDPHREGVLGGPGGYQALREALEADSLDAQVAAYSRGDVEADVRARAADKGRKYVVVPRELGEELLHQITPPPVPRTKMETVFGKGWGQRWNNAFSRAVLGYSPSWALAQVLAEGLPMAAAIASPNPRHWWRVARTLREERDLPPADKAALDGMVGESLGTVGMPRVAPFDPKVTIRANAAMRRSRIYRGLIAAAKGRAFHGFDRWKGGKFRKFLEAARVDKELNTFHRSLGGVMMLSEKVAKDMRGMNLTDARVYLARNPKTARQIERYLDDVMGNWRALTRFEAKFAPAVAFYPFVRYSLRWAFQSFPRQHPVKANILYFMAQLNAEQLEQLIGAKPVDFTQYAFPVIHLGEDDAKVMPGGRRLAPGANALIEAIGRGNVDHVLTALPGVAFLAQVGTGKNLFFGESQEGMYSQSEILNRGLIALHQLLSYPTPLRAANVPDTVLDALGADSTVSEPGLGRDALSEKSIRSNIVPLTLQDGDKFADEVALSRAYDTRSKIKEKRVVPVKPGPIDWGVAGDDPEAQAELREQARQADEAQAVIDRIRGPRPEDPEFERGMERYWEERDDSSGSSSGSGSASSILFGSPGGSRRGGGRSSSGRSASSILFGP